MVDAEELPQSCVFMSMKGVEETFANIIRDNGEHKRQSKQACFMTLGLFSDWFGED